MKGRAVIIYAMVMMIMLIFPVIQNAKSESQELTIINKTLTIKGEYVQDGSIIVGSNGTLIISGELTVLQDYDYQYNVVVEENGTLLMENGGITSNYALEIIIESNAYLEVINSSMDFSGSLISFSDTVFSKSRIYVTNMYFDAQAVSVTETEIRCSSFHMDNTGFYAEDTIITAPINASKNTVCDLINVTIPSILVDENSVAYIYRWLTINVKDAVNVPVAGVNLQFKYAADETETLSDKTFLKSDFQFGFLNRSTDKNGHLRIEILTDIIRSFDAQFVGNYKIEISYTGFTASALVSLPYYKPVSDLEKIDNTKSIDIIFSQVFISSYYSAGFDIVISNENKTFEDTNSHQNGVTYTYIQDGNVRVINGTLTIKNNALLNIFQKENKKYYISVEDGGLIIQNGGITSDYPLNVYLHNAYLKAEDSNINVNIIANENSNILLTDTAVNGNIHAKCNNVDIESSTIKSSSIVINSKNLSISDSVISSASLSLHSSEISIEDSSFDHPLKLSNDAYLTNVSAPLIIPVGNATIYKCYWLTVIVKNGHNKVVQNAGVMLYRLENLTTEKFYSSGSTNKNGIAVFKVKSSEFTAENESFVGNYKIIADHPDTTEPSPEIKISVNSNKQVTLYFTEILTPPYEITIDVDFTPVCSPKDIITVSGSVYYNHNPTDVASNANITIELNGEFYNTTTGTDGKYSISIVAPEEGVYSVNVTAVEPMYNLQKETGKKLTVKIKKYELNIWLFIGSIMVIALSIAGIMLSARKSAIRKTEVVSGVESVRRKEIIRWIMSHIGG